MGEGGEIGRHEADTENWVHSGNGVNNLKEEEMQNKEEKD